MKLVMLDRDGVINAPRKYNVKSPAELEFLPDAPGAIARLNAADVRVAICTNQPEVARGIITERQLDAIHEDMCKRLARYGAHIDLVLCCIDDDWESGASKPAPGMLLEAMRHFGARPVETPFVGDQLDDLEAAANAHCRRILVRSGNGRKTERDGIRNTVRPDEVHDDLAAFVDAYLRSRRRSGLVPLREPPPLLVGRKIRDHRRRRAASE